MNFTGILLGLATLIIIGLGFVWVIRGERYFGVLWWPYVLGVGILLILGALFPGSDWAAALLGSLGASLVWGATELKEQSARAGLGWVARHPNKIRPPFANTIEKWRAPHL